MSQKAVQREKGQLRDLEGELRAARDLVARLEAELEAASGAPAVGGQSDEERFRQLFEEAPLGYQSLDADGNFLAVNQAWLETLGYSREEVLGRNFGDFLADEWGDHFKENFPRFKALGEILGVEFELVRKDGTRVLAAFNGKIGRDADGRFKQTHCIFHDITERRRVEQAVRQNEERFRTLFAGISSVAVQGYRPDGTVRYWNAASEKFYGYSAEEAVGRNICDLVLPAHLHEAFRADVRRMVETGQPLPSAELVLRRKDGAEVEVLSSHAIVAVPGCEPELFCLDVDLAARKRAEEAMLSAKAQAEEASRAKSEFLANMSHEIRTPLNGLLGMMHLLKGTALDGEQRQYVDMAIRSSDRLTELLSDILDLSRVEAGRMELVREEFTLQGLIGSIVETFGPLGSEKRLSLGIGIEPDLPPVLLGDEVRIRQVLFNLVGNAMKFTEQGGVVVEACGLPSPCPGEVRVLFTVRDSGIGIPDDKLGIIFTGFMQADTGKSRRHQGAGLGLTISKRLVELMGGTMAVETEQGVGSAFYVSLPLGLPEAGSGAAASAGAPLSELRPGLRILLAEDERMNRLFATRLLEKLGQEVTAVENGREALQALRADDFDLVLMDVQMPELDGLEATRALRDRTAFGPKADIPVIAVTAHAMAGDREEFLAAGMTDYIAKPIDSAQLVHALCRVQASLDAGRAADGRERDS
ncbi:PAS/PAC sensor hybrid histidine kinase [Desulfovibrio sp. X2]|uniref:PAS domain-containing hybrid sensor histidine kinase/response regulator n=1 Tax=Desulfovibrio sp. X2 TaxID=941449 RepID=UPI000358F13F|nr:PAS domain-containing hybrid sensor histidine kinase/response regulator [Desulfovibrio sp. X2]EPR37672.1 PAS/PAC sensor hybrid histidine kinase [Desulfovibrio sp. X2]